MRKNKQTYPSSILLSVSNLVYQTVVNKITVKFNRKKIKPWMDERQIDLIEWLLKTIKPKVCLEWGVGLSTLYFPKFLDKNAKWYAVEHDCQWSDKIKLINKNKNVSINYVKPNHFPWTDVNGDGAYSDLKDYVDFPDKLGKFDFILVDGRARGECLEKARQILTQNGIIVLHDAQREYYHNALGFYKYGIVLHDNYSHRDLWVGSKDIDITYLINIKKLQKLWSLHECFKKAIENAAHLVRRLRALKPGKIYQTITSILSGKIHKEFLSALYHNRRLLCGSLWLSLFVTSRCNVNCDECIMGNLRRTYPDYQMSLDEVKKFIEVSERSHYSFDIILTGGEPLSWDYFEEGTRLLKSSKICNSLHLFTNAMGISGLNHETVKYLDRIRISRYEGNRDNAAKLFKMFPGKVQIVDRREFWANPTHKIPDTVPARCCNQEVMLFNYRVYACPHSVSLAFTSHSDVKLSNPLEDRFLVGMSQIKKMQQDAVCSLCISNLNVREKAEKVKNRGSLEQLSKNNTDKTGA